MPTYVYRFIDDPTDQTFEIHQSIRDAALTHHPETGQPIERMIVAPMIGKGATSNRELGAAGFTKYAKMADGTYERQAGGAGPKHIDPRKLAGE